MSEKHEIDLFDRIEMSIAQAQREMIIRKAKLGEKVIVGDADGNPIELSASEALPLYPEP